MPPPGCCINPEVLHMFKKKDPRKKDTEPHWTMDNVEPGSGFNAWKAGDLIGVLCHWNYRSVPCRYELTDGAMECPHHLTNPNLHWVGYLPLYSEENRPTVVIVRAATQELVDRIPVHAPVYVSRTKKRGAGVSVKRKDWAKQWQPPRGFTGPADIRRWLLKLWKDDELAQWVLAHPVSDTAVSQITDGAGSDGAAAAASGRSEEWVRGVQKEMLKQNGHHEAAANLPPPADDTFGAVVGRLKRKAASMEPSRNGTHHAGEG